MSWKGRNLAVKHDRMAVAVKSHQPMRVDRYLTSALGWRSRSRVQTLIRTGRVLVNGERSKPARRVRQGDEIVVELSEGTGVPRDYAARELEILYEDPWLVAVNKPPGMLVHPVGRHVYDTLINYLHHRYRSAPGAEDGARDGDDVVPRLCHRIDRDTTGVLLVAKDALVHKQIMRQFEERHVDKEYICLAHGRYPVAEDVVSIPLGEGRCLESCLRHPSLKPSRTRVRVLHHLDGVSLLACTPHTGRQNQIRVHLAAVGHPIVGDERYGGSPAPPGYPERFLLHSRRLCFYHEPLKSRVELIAPLPEDFRRLVVAALVG